MKKLKAVITSLNTRIYREKLRDKPDSSRLAQLTALLKKPGSIMRFSTSTSMPPILN